MPEQSKKAPYVKPEYSFTEGCACPRCGKEMEAAVYYVAEFAGQHSHSQWQGGTRKTTTVTQYRNIRSKLGGFCVDCYKKERLPNIILEAIILAVLLGGTILFVTLISKSGAIALFAAAVCGWFSLQFLFALLEDYRRSHRLNSEKANGKRAEILSILYVEAYKKIQDKPCGTNEVLIDSFDAQRLNKQ